MAGGHSHAHHSHRDVPDAEVGIAGRLTLTIALALMAAVTIFGLVRYWPSDEVSSSTVTSSDFAAPGVTFPIATVRGVLPACTGPASQVGAPPADGQAGDAADPASTCGAIRVDLGAAPSGEPTDLTLSVPAPISTSGLKPGDKVQLMRVPATAETPAAYSFLQVQRGAPLALLLVLFIVVVALVARLRGLLALLGLGFGGLVLVKFMLPALLEGQPGLRVAVLASAAIMFVVLYLAHGLSVRTSTALAGTLIGVGITAGLGLMAVAMARLSGVADDDGATLASFNADMNPRELLTAAIIVAGLGVLNDVTITQSSAVWELRAAAPHMSRRELYRSGMRIGRDHIASTIYTIVFAYAGAALPVLLLLFIYDRPVLDLLQTESMSEEIVRTLASAIGLVLAVPATTAIAALTVSGPRTVSEHDARWSSPPPALPPEVPLSHDTLGYGPDTSHPMGPRAEELRRATVAHRGADSRARSRRQRRH